MTPRRLKTGQLAESISAAGPYALSWRKSTVAHGPDRSLRPVPDSCLD